jgi:hypothetical protein
MEEPVNDHPKGLCPICRDNGVKFSAALHGLAGHLEREHTVKDLIYAVANEACLQYQEGEPARCAAHGEANCDLCSLNPADCSEPGGQCEVYRTTGMHGDTCPNRIRSYEDAVKRLNRFDHVAGFDTIYMFDKQEDWCPECGGVGGEHNSVTDPEPWGSTTRSCTRDPRKVR